VVVAKVFRKPVLFYAVEIGPVNTRFGKWCTRFVLNTFFDANDLMIVRNRESLEILESFGVNRLGIQITADPVYSVETNRSGRGEEILRQHGIDPGRRIIGVAPRKTFYMNSGWLPVHVRFKLNLLPDSFRQKYDRFKEALASTADHLIRNLDAQILLIPMDTARNPKDELVCEEIKDRMCWNRQVRILAGDYGYEDFLALYGLMDLVISSRYHALVFASMAHVPLVGISSERLKTQDKVGRLMFSLDQGHRCITADEIVVHSDGRRLIRLVEEVWSERGDIHEKLRPKVMELRDMSIGNSVYLEEMLEKVGRLGTKLPRQD
jgi:polysaccharide pyruvyl transferase WcaK-like protein